MRIRAVVKRGGLEPTEPLDLRDGEEVEVVVIESFHKWIGVLAPAGADSVRTQHDIGDAWAERHGRP